MNFIQKTMVLGTVALGTWTNVWAKDFKHEFSEFVIEERAANNLIGLSAAIMLPNGEWAAYASGVTDPITNTPLSPKDLMLAGSVGKVLWASVALQLADEGVIDLDAKISAYIGDRVWFERLPNANDITLRSLMNHTTGIPRHIMADDFLDFYTEENQKNPNFNMTTEEVLHYALDKEPLFGVGKNISYADTNYIVMKYIIENVTGREYYDLIKERVIDPLELKEIVASSSRDVPGLTVGNLSDDNLFRVNSPTNKDKDGNLLYNPGIEGAGGGYAATPLGLVRLAKGLYEEKLISDGMYGQKMDTVTMAEGEGFRIGYGLGVMTYDVEFGHAIGHSGFFPGYRTDMYYFPKEGVAIAVMINSTVPVKLTQIALGLADKVMKSEGIRKAD